MKKHNAWWRLGAMAAGTLLVAGTLTGCANWFDGSDDGGGGSPAATTSSVADALNQRFDNIDRDLTLWNIQPGLGTIMIEYGKRFFMVQKAVAEGDWGMASYQLKEALEIQEVGEITRSGNADKLKAFEHNFLDPISDDIQGQNATKFDTDFNAAIGGCNDCHTATGHPFIVAQAATQIPEVNVDLAASDPVPVAEESHNFTDPALPFGLDQVLTSAEVGDLIDFYFNTLNRNLALWNIQPGLGTVMIEYATRFAMANYAAQAGNWGMAAYQIKEALEIQEVGEFTRSQFASGLKNFEGTYIPALNQAIADEDGSAFDTAYSTAISGCNACHVANGHPFVRVIQPTRNPEPLLDLAAGAAAASVSTSANPESSEESTFPADAPVIPDNPTLDDAQAAVDYRLNHIDRNLTLWNLQPGLGTVMIEYGERMARLWFAVQTGNWGMAAYQLKEALEIQETGEITRSGNADLLKNFEDNFLTVLDTDIENQDQAQFETDFADALTGCNDCHAATGHSFIKVQTPPSVVDYLDLEGGAGAVGGGDNDSGTGGGGTGGTSGADAAHGASLYSTNCSACHGADASGGLGPALAGSTLDRTIVRNGTDTGMPVFGADKLSDADLDDIDAWLTSL